ncbi:helix-turn-helix transcriptional regulator [Streptomyces sp. NPDC051664]|uniref:helix-turn-helix transcriptional regulator n=1 Tax=Streptomyces sp. NPDC051664 TaxID=3365668 RepID=UPI00378873DC
MSTRPMLNQREAADACGVSRTTIRRRREAGDLPGAVQDPARGWLIPVDDLLAAGFRLNAPAPPDAPDEPAPSSPTGQNSDVGGGQDVAAVRAELERVRQEHALALAQAEHGRQLAQTEADHLRAQLAIRGEHIADLQRTLKALMPAPEQPVLDRPSVPGQTQTEPPAGSVPKEKEPARGEQRRWWRRA